jgi:hypothetical protein
MPAEQRAKLGNMQEKTMALLTASVSKSKHALAKLYSDTYTEEELDGILEFYKSPAGKVFMQKLPEVMQRSVPLMTQMTVEMQAEINMMAEEMREK